MAALSSPRPLLRQGSNGSSVRELQTMLNRQVKPVPPLVEDGVFGPATRAAVVNFQSKSKLITDGIVGPNTWASLDKAGPPAAPTLPKTPPATGTSLIEQAVVIALGEVGVREQPEGSNRGPKVDAYNTTAGVPTGSFWCMSFVYWCFTQAASRTSQPNPMPKTAYCPFLYDWGRKNGKLVTTPQRGDIFLVKGMRDGKPSHIHTGIVTGGSVNTVEGNTNNDGSHNGIGVFTRTRSLSTCDYVRL